LAAENLELVAQHQQLNVFHMQPAAGANQRTELDCARAVERSAGVVSRARRAAAHELRGALAVRTRARQQGGVSASKARLAFVIGEELRRLLRVEERHRRLLARLLIALGLTVLVAVAGSLLTYLLESGRKGGDIHGFGDAVFFTAVQLLTVSSSIKNPVTAAGKVVDVALEAWAIFVVTAVAGSFASFFSSGDSR
jgi:hypothetical protein